MHVNLRTLVLAVAISALSSLSIAADASLDEPVSLNFSDADIISVIDAIGRISGRNFIIDPRVKGTINIITNTPVPRKLSYQVLLSALRLQGYTAVESDGVTKIIPEADAKVYGGPVGDASTQAGQSLVTQVFPMRHESAAQMLAVVRPLVSPNNTVTAFPSNNVLVVTDYAENLKRIGEIIASVDVPKGDISVIPLEYAIAEDLAETVNQLMNNGGTGNNTMNAGNAQGEQIKKIQIIAEARTNSLLVRSDNPALIRDVRQLALSLDRPGAGGNIHVIYLRNAEAEKVAQTLNAALSGDTSALSSSGISSSGLFSNSNTSTTTSGTQDGRTIANLNSSSNNSSYGSYEGGNGVVKADKLNNALIIVAPDAIYRNIRYVVDLLDRRRAQVYIEALVAEISAERAAEIGIQWQVGGLLGGGSGALAGTNFGGVGNSGNLLQAMANPSSVAGGFNFLIGRGKVQIPDGQGGMMEVFNLGLLANFLESDARNNILSTPNIVTLDNEEAKIMVGSEVPFLTGQYTNTGSSSDSVNPFQTIDRKDVGLTLEVRPQISEGGTIKLDIYQETSSVANTGADAAKYGPTTHKRSIRSTVLVDDGNIIALGGLVQDDYTTGEEKVPFLGDLPIAGNLFRYNSRRRSKTNLVVFLRPVILRDGDSYNEITSSRYDYVIGQQRLSKGRLTLKGEGDPPELPSRNPPEESQISDAPAPVREAAIVQVNREDRTE